MKIHLKAGKILKYEDRIVFQSSDKKGTAEFPLQAENCLSQLQKGVELDTYIADQQSRGKAVDYISLKTVLLGLYHGNCIKNRHELTPYLDSWSHPPLREAMLHFPLLHARPRQAEEGKGMVLFALTCIAYIAFLASLMPFTSALLTPSVRFWTFVALAPAGFQSTIAIFFHLISSLTGQTHSGLGARLSPLGLHFETEPTLYKAYPLASLTIAVILAAALPLDTLHLLAPFAPEPTSLSLVKSLFEGIAAAFVAMQLIPGLKSSWSWSRYELAKRGKLQGINASSVLSSFYMGSAVTGLCLGFGFIALRLLDTLRFFGKPSAVWDESGVGGFLVLAAGVFYATFMLRDLLYGIEYLADDVHLFRPVQEQIEKFKALVTLRGDERTQKEIKEILASHTLFQQLPQDFRQELSAASSIIRCGAGSRLIRQGSNTTDLFIVLDGTVGVYRREYDHSESRLIVRLNPGAVFGEAGFFFGDVRTADCVALDTVRILRIKRPARAMLKQSPEALEQFRLKLWATQALSNSDLFRHLPNEALFQILNGSEIVRMNKGEFVTLEGEPSDSLWICIQGSAKVSVNDIPRNDIKMGDVVGEIGLIWDVPRTATVISEDKSIYMKLPAWQVRNLFSRNLFLAARLQELGSERLYRDKKSGAA